MHFFSLCSSLVLYFLLTKSSKISKDKKVKKLKKCKK